MDDPWGTPWTSTDQSSSASRPVVSLGQSLASLPQDDPRNEDQNSRPSTTPWTDNIEVEFGDWTKANPIDEIAAAPIGWGNLGTANSTRLEQDTLNNQEHGYDLRDTIVSLSGIPQESPIFQSHDEQDDHGDPFATYIDPWKAGREDTLDGGGKLFNFPASPAVSNSILSQHQDAHTISGADKVYAPGGSDNFSGTGDSGKEYYLNGDTAPEHRKRPETPRIVSTSSEADQNDGGQVDFPPDEAHLQPGVLPAATEEPKPTPSKPVNLGLRTDAANIDLEPASTQIENAAKEGGNPKAPSPSRPTTAESSRWLPMDSSTHESKGDDAAELYFSGDVIQDSFTTVSERKAWYRISRRESCRRYNAGNEDNYRPVSWNASSVRVSVLKIVRRWMEEDSLAGKPTLGGSGVRGNVFGWDSAAEPVALDVVYKRKPRGSSPGSLAHRHTRRPKERNDALPARGVSDPVLQAGICSRAVETGNVFTAHSIKGATGRQDARETTARPDNGASVFASSYSPDTDKRHSPSTDITNAGPDSSEDEGWGDMVSPTTDEPGELLPEVLVCKTDGHPSPVLPQPVTGGSAGFAAEEHLDFGRRFLDRQESQADKSSPRTFPPLVSDGTWQHRKQTGQAWPPEDLSIQAIIHGLPDLTYMDR